MHRLLGRIRKQQLIPYSPLARLTRYTDNRKAQGVGLLTTSLVLIQSALLDTPNPLRRPRRLSSAHFLFLIQPSKPLLPRLLNLRPGVCRTKSRQRTSFSLCAPPPRPLLGGRQLNPTQPTGGTRPTVPGLNAAFPCRPPFSFSSPLPCVLLCTIVFPAAPYGRRLYYNSYPFPFNPLLKLLLSAKPAYITKQKTNIRYLGFDSVGGSALVASRLTCLTGWKEEKTLHF